MPSMKSRSRQTPAPNAQNDNHVGACPVCDDAAKSAYKPFCSRRCADVDLHRWLEGGYAIPAVESEASAFDRDEDD